VLIAFGATVAIYVKDSADVSLRRSKRRERLPHFTTFADEND